MTHPLTPRAKVAQIIKEMVSGPHFSDPSHFVAMEQDRFVAADAILTALASGSGDHSGGVTDMIDHAELARLAETNKAYGFLVSVRPETILSLLAEIAALRGDVDQARTLHHRSTDRARHFEIEALRWNNRATEAERKLAEADGLMIELADAPQPKDTGGRFFRAMSSINAYVAQLNASKEAERG